MQTNATTSDHCQPVDAVTSADAIAEVHGNPHQPATVTGNPVSTERPLFIPLKREFFHAFLNGTKREEFRRHGKQWNRETCRVGRRVTLSNGYGTHARLTGTITGFRLANAPDDVPAGWLTCYGAEPTVAACITIALDWFQVFDGGTWIPDPHAITPTVTAPA